MDDSPLNNIPAELRNRIYEYALHEKGSVAISPNFITEPGLLRTCKQVRAEAELLFYAVNRFTAVCPFRANGADHLIKWVEHKEGKRLSLIQRLTIRIEAPGLRSLYWDCDFESKCAEIRRNALATFWYRLPTKLKRLDIGTRRPEALFYFHCNGMSDETPWAYPNTFGGRRPWWQQCTCWMPAMTITLDRDVPDGIGSLSTYFGESEMMDLRCSVWELHDRRKAAEASSEGKSGSSDPEEQTQETDQGSDV